MANPGTTASSNWKIIGIILFCVEKIAKGEFTGPKMCLHGQNL
jgi:hypothetical protein